MPIQGLNYNIPSGFERHQSYQSTGSFTVYNPNDGVAFIATDRTATGISWDYKVPSQSGGHFPGPINSYLSIFYLDQSGSGAAGQIVVYATAKPLDIPYFWSIGRAIQSQSTSMDIVEGSQPANPGAGIDRIWADTNGLIHHLHSNGVDTILTDPLQTSVVTSGMIVPGAAQSLLNYYIAIPSWSTTTTGAWIATPISVTAITGQAGVAWIRLEAFSSFNHSVAGGLWFMGFGVDGAVTGVASINTPIANIAIPWTGFMYSQPAAGSHTFTVYVYNGTAGTLSINAAQNSGLFVNEQRR